MHQGVETNMEAYISGNPLNLAVTTCNVSYRRQIDGETLLSLLKGENGDFEKWKFHVQAFFNEVHPCIIAKIAVDNEISIESLGKTFFGLDKVYQEENFLELYNAAKNSGLERIWQENGGRCCLTMPCGM